MTLSITSPLSLFVPGRLCLFGEHSDWAGLQRVINADIAPGAAIVTGIEQGIYADVCKSDLFIMRNVSDELKDTWVDFKAEMNVESLKDIAAEGSYFSYVAGVASYINEHYNVGGMEITITKMTLPVKSGLSSSAAICVLVARAFNTLYGLNMNTIGEMAAAYRGERRTASRCGRMDQACAFGTSPVVMRFDGEEIDVKRISVKNPLHWVIANLQGNKDTIKILSDLNKRYPFAENPIDKYVHEALGLDNQNIIAKAIEHIKNGEAKELGELMTKAQKIFDDKVAPASPEQLKAPILHKFLANETVKSLTYGGKGVGSQGDGSIQFLAKDVLKQNELVEYLSNSGLEAYAFTIPKRSQVRKAIIPVAGFGTRLYPATRFINKEFMPVVDKDGMLKPVIMILLEELYDCGIEEICLVVGSDEDIEMYKWKLLEPITDTHKSKLNEKLRRYEDKLANIGKRLTFCLQKERLGFGHAVLQAKGFCMDEPVALILGDTIYQSNTDKPCCMQLMESYDDINCPLISVCETNINDVPKYGIVSGEWTNDTLTAMKVTRFVEKPDVATAKKSLGMANKHGGKSYHSVFGQYILTPQVFREIEKNIEKGVQKNSEYQLTDAMAALIGGHGLYAVKLDGMMYDIGNVEAYRNAFIHYGAG